MEDPFFALETAEGAGAFELPDARDVAGEPDFPLAVPEEVDGRVPSAFFALTDPPAALPAVWSEAGSAPVVSTACISSGGEVESAGRFAGFVLREVVAFAASAERFGVDLREDSLFFAERFVDEPVEDLAPVEALAVVRPAGLALFNVLLPPTWGELRREDESTERALLRSLDPFFFAPVLFFLVPVVVFFVAVPVWRVRVL